MSVTTCIGINSDISFLKFRVSCSACRMNGGSSGGTCKLKFNTTCWLLQLAVAVSTKATASPAR